MSRFIAAVLAWGVWLGIVVSGQQGDEGPIRASLAREIGRAASTPVLSDEPEEHPVFGVSAIPARQRRAADWSVVRGLDEGTRVVVVTSRGLVSRGRISGVTNDALRIIDGQGDPQTLQRADLREVRLGHRLTVGQTAGLGLLMGSAAGLVLGRAGECNCELRGAGTAVGAVYGTLMGGVIGWGIGRSVDDHPGRLIYRSPAP